MFFKKIAVVGIHRFNKRALPNPTQQSEVSISKENGIFISTIPTSQSSSLNVKGLYRMVEKSPSLLLGKTSLDAFDKRCTYMIKTMIEKNKALYKHTK